MAAGQAWVAQQLPPLIRGPLTSIMAQCEAEDFDPDQVDIEALAQVRSRAASKGAGGRSGCGGGNCAYRCRRAITLLRIWSFTTHQRPYLDGTMAAANVPVRVPTHV